jgi:hypothetical protein
MVRNYHPYLGKRNNNIIYFYEVTTGMFNFTKTPMKSEQTGQYLWHSNWADVIPIMHHTKYLHTISYEINFWNYMTFFSQARRNCGTTHFIRPCTILHATGFGLPPNFEDLYISTISNITADSLVKVDFDFSLVKSEIQVAF